MTEPGGVGTPGTEAGRGLGLGVVDQLGVQFKTNEGYRYWLQYADRLAVRVEAEATRAERERIARAVEELPLLDVPGVYVDLDAVLTMVRDEP